MGAPEPVTTAVPAPYMSTGSAASEAIEYSSMSPETMILVSVAPSESSSSRECWASTDRSPESIRMARRSGPATAIALRMPCAMSYVSTSSVVFLPSAATWDANAAGSSSCSSVKACAEVPVVGMPYRPPAARLEVDGETGEVGGAGRGHGGLLMRTPGAHLDDRPAPRRGDHPGGAPPRSRCRG